MSIKINNKKGKILQFFICFFILDSIACQNYNHTFERIAVTFQNLVNTYTKTKEKIINLSPTTSISIQSLTCFFLFDRPQINPIQASIKYINPNLTFTFDVVLTKKLLSRRGRDLTVKIEKAVGYLNYKYITIYKQADNSFDYEKMISYQEGYIDLNPFTPYEIFNETVEYLKKEGIQMLVDAWNNIFEQVLIIYPVCDSYRNYLELKNYLTTYKYFIVNNPDEPDLRRLQFINIEYSSISKNYLSSVTINSLRLEIDYNMITDFRRNVSFDSVNFTSNYIEFGEFYPYYPTLGRSIEYIMTDALHYLLNFKK